MIFSRAGCRTGLDAIAAALLWVWFINLFNFMDGIDGIAGSEAAAIGIGIVVVGAVAGGVDPRRAGNCDSGGRARHLVWNWAPARIFLGDAGSVPPSGICWDFCCTDSRCGVSGRRR